jgi:predicted RNA binding protein YcfA (HicA-like mRNA interferase family)
VAKIKKIVEKMLRLPPEMRFAEVNIVLEYFDWELINVDGSHFHYEKSGYPDIVIVQHKKRVKRGYIRAIIEIQNLEEWYEQN